MIGIPKIINTKKDWLNAVDYSASADVKAKNEMVLKLKSLRDSRFILVLKAGVKTVPEKQTADDYEQIEDLGCELNKLGFSVAEINLLIARVED